MAEQDNIKTVRKSFDVLNNHDLDSGDQYYASDMRVEAAGSTAVMDKAGNKRYTQGFISTFPDLHFQLKDIIAQGNKVASTWVAHGMHQGSLLTPTGDTIPPTNRKVEVPGCTIYEFNPSGLIVRQEIYWDTGVLMSQLGILQAQGGRSSTSR